MQMRHIFNKMTVFAIFVLFSQSSISGGFENRLVDAAIERTKHNVRYDGAYFSIPYPNGDAPSDQRSSNSGNPLIAHNIGAGPRLEDMLFDHKITGHYRYTPQEI